MLCSLPTAAKSKSSSSSWLDRLHSLKGFTTPPTSSTPSPPNPNPNPTSSSPPPQLHPQQPFHAVTAILSDLFVMDPPPHSPATAAPHSKRGFRKQPAPKICLLKTTRTRRNSSSPFSPAANAVSSYSPELKIKRKNRDNKLILLKKKNKNKSSSSKQGNIKEDKSNSKSNSKSKVIINRRIEAASDASASGGAKGQTEATVIDTSTPGWKSAKVLIRKGSIWKVRDKKQWNAGLGKRKRFNRASNKEKDLLKSEKPSDPLDQEDNDEEPIDVTEVPFKRPKCSKLPSIPEAAKSIALHLKVRTNGKKKILSSNSALKEIVQH